MRLNAEKVDNLPESRVDLFRRHVDSLSASQSEATNRGDFVDCLDREDLIDESRLLQPCEQLLDTGSLVVHLLLHVLLQVQLLLELIELGPELTLIVLNVRLVALEGLDLRQLFGFLSFNPLQIIVQLGQLSFECFAFFGLLVILIPF